MPDLQTSIHAMVIDGIAPDWVHLIPAGTFGTRDGRGPFRLDDADAVIAATLDLKMDLPIDYDHAIDFLDAGQAKPAAGWIKEFESRADGIWARVEWTPKATEALREKEWRYLSPVFEHTKDGKVIRIIRAGLTNSPALVLKAVASKEDFMDKFLTKLAKALGLADGSGEDAILARMAQLVDAEKSGPEKTAAARTAIAEAAGLTAKASADDIVKAVAAMKTATAGGGGGEPDPEKYVTVAAFDAVNKTLASVKAGIAKDKAEISVSAAIEAGKLPPAQRDWALAYCQRSPDEFAKFIDTQPAIVVAGRTAPVVDPKTGEAGLTADEVAICGQLGITEAAFIKTRKAEKEGVAR